MLHGLRDPGLALDAADATATASSQAPRWVYGYQGPIEATCKLAAPLQQAARTVLRLDAQALEESSPARGALAFLTCQPA